MLRFHARRPSCPQGAGAQPFLAGLRSGANTPAKLLAPVRCDGLLTVNDGDYLLVGLLVSWLVNWSASWLVGQLIRLKN